MSRPEIEVVVEDGATECLAARAAGQALVVMDANTRDVAGEVVTTALEAAGEIVFPQRTGLLAGPQEVSAVQEQIAPGVTPVAVGSGVITDIVRYAAHRAGTDFLSFPTAASMDGYASSVAALQTGGVKVTYPARAPRGIYAEPRLLAAAPAELTRAGIGDLLAKATARVDWLAAHLLYGESYDAAVSERVLALLRRTSAQVERLLSGEPAATRELLLGLIESGMVIAQVGSSRPASGCEHHASHFWDLLAARGRRPHHLHGLQVGYATHFAMRLQRFAFDGPVGQLRRPLPPVDMLDAGAREWLGEPTPELLEAVAGKRNYLTGMGADLAGTQAAVSGAPSTWLNAATWDELRQRLGQAMEPFDGVRNALEAAGIPPAPGFMGIDSDLLRATFRYSNRLRARYTVVDFLDSQGQLEPALDSIFDA